MARSDLIVSLVKAGIKGDPAEVRATAEAIAADERAKRHSGVADRIARALDTIEPASGNGGQFRPRLRLRETGPAASCDGNRGARLTTSILSPRSVLPATN